MMGITKLKNNPKINKVKKFVSFENHEGTTHK